MLNAKTHDIIREIAPNQLQRFINTSTPDPPRFVHLFRFHSSCFAFTCKNSFVSTNTEKRDKKISTARYLVSRLPSPLPSDSFLKIHILRVLRLSRQVGIIWKVLFSGLTARQKKHHAHSVRVSPTSINKRLHLAEDLFLTRIISLISCPSPLRYICMRDRRICKSRALFMIEHEIVRTRPTPSWTDFCLTTATSVSHDSVLDRAS